MFKYITGLVATGCLLKGIYDYKISIDKKNKLKQSITDKFEPDYQNIHDNEYIYEHNFDDSSRCFKVIIETYKMYDDNLFANGKLSFVHTEDKLIKLKKCDHNPKDLTNTVEYVTNLFNRDDAEKLLRNEYGLNLNKLLYYHDYNFAKIHFGSEIKKIFIFNKIYNDKKIMIAFSNDLDILLNDITKNYSVMYICFSCILYILALLKSTYFYKLIGH